MTERRSDAELRALVAHGDISAESARTCRRHNLALRIDAQILAFEVRAGITTVREAATTLAHRGLPADRCVHLLCRRTPQ